MQTKKCSKTTGMVSYKLAPICFLNKCEMLAYIWQYMRCYYSLPLICLVFLFSDPSCAPLPASWLSPGADLPARLGPWVRWCRAGRCGGKRGPVFLAGPGGVSLGRLQVVWRNVHMTGSSVCVCVCRSSRFNRSTHYTSPHLGHTASVIPHFCFWNATLCFLRYLIFSPFQKREMTLVLRTLMLNNRFPDSPWLTC